MTPLLQRELSQVGTTPNTHLEPSLKHESSIIWLEDTDPSEYDYVRVQTTTDQPKDDMDNMVLGYAVLKNTAPDRVQRRVFTLTDGDRRDVTNCPQYHPYRIGAPTSAVDPRTVSPGELGTRTGRTLGLHTTNNLENKSLP